MPEHIVVRCYSCRTHQVIQENKKRKFSCRLCGSLQSVKAVLASGSAGRELREIVQQLNLEKGKEEEEQRLQRVASLRAAAALPEATAGASCAPAVADAPTSSALPSARWGRFCQAAPRAAGPDGPAEGNSEEAGFATNFGAGWALGGGRSKRKKTEDRHPEPAEQKKRCQYDEEPAGRPPASPWQQSAARPPQPAAAPQPVARSRWQQYQQSAPAAPQAASAPAPAILACQRTSMQGNKEPEPVGGSRWARFMNN
eukprot:TRINITY_DN37377_c0_g1_i2.p1 TRINITY_DN37377_c0_g1~~TRINITY_DN37377_c0_g1_i2.p1  ORF type:complete len:266 (+),score=54.17 TRINITY_DN37377_c0_g1_i2:33-800(+)